MQNNILELENISKKIKNRQIVKNINLVVKSSEIFGFLGPNGAGKTTTIRMIVGLAKPTSGEVNICGYSLKNNYIRAMSNIGCIIEGPDMYKYLTGMENLFFLAYMDKRITRARIDEVIEMVGLKNRIYDKVGVYSLGMRQRLGIAQAIMSKPKILILDEPTNGLDPSGIAEFRNLIRKLAYEEGMAVFVSSHILAEVQQMCDTVAIISRGEIVKSFQVNNIEEDKIIEWDIDDPSSAMNILSDKFKINSEQIKTNTIRACIGKVNVEEVNKSFIEAGLRLSFCKYHENSLEELFLKVTKGDEIV
jgi:ABC-2 type transport system ATP-binding protein